MRTCVRTQSLWREPRKAVGMQQQQSANQGAAGMWVYVPRKPADWNPYPRTVEEALDQLAAGGSAVAAANMFVWQPGGTAGANVYTTLATLEAALQDVEGPKIVGVDTTHGAATIDTTGMPAGGWRLNDTTWMPALSTVVPLVSISEGAKFAPSTQKLSFVNFEVANNATATTVWTPAGGAAYIKLDTAVLDNTAAGAFLDCGAGGTVELFVYGSALASDGTHPLILVEATGTLDLALFTGSSIETNVVGQGVASGGAANIFSDGSSIVSRTQGAGPVYAYIVEDPTPSFLFKPGATGAQDGNVFLTWAALYAAASQVAGPVTVRVDDSVAAAHMTAGAYTLDGWTFTGNGSNTLIIDVGVTWTNTNIVTFEDVNVTNNATAVVWDYTGAEGILYVRGGITIESTSTGPLAENNASSGFGFIVIAYLFATIGDGTHAVVQTQAGKTSVIELVTGVTVAANALSGGGTALTRFDSSSSANGTQSVTTFTPAAISSAGSTSYTAATAGNWNPNPTTAKQALDQLAAPNVVSQKGNGGTGTHTVTVTTQNITKAKNGSITGGVFISGTSAAADTMTVSLVRDVASANVTVASTTVVTNATTLTYNAGFSFVDTLPDAAAHTYSIVCAGAQNNTVAANGAAVWAREDS